VWPGQMHVFQIAAPMVPEADRSLRQIGNYIREATDRSDCDLPVSALPRVGVTRRRSGVVADSGSNRLPPPAIRHRTGDS
jgi:hypothetical protein